MQYRSSSIIRPTPRTCPSMRLTRAASAARLSGARATRGCLGARVDPFAARVNRIDGQVRGVGRMIDEDRYCIDILTQVAAIRSALDALAIELLEHHLQGCVQHAVKSGEGEPAIAEALSVIRRFAR